MLDHLFIQSLCLVPLQDKYSKALPDQTDKKSFDKKVSSVCRKHNLNPYLQWSEGSLLQVDPKGAKSKWMAQPQKKLSRGMSKEKPPVRPKQWKQFSS